MNKTKVIEMQIIGITGGKGGTGKSTIATALAVELGKKFKVLLVDADADCPNDHLILNIKRHKVKSVFQRIPKIDFKKCIKCGKCGKNCKTHAIVSIKEKKPIFLPQQCNGCGVCEFVCPVKAITWEKKEIGKVFKGRNFGIEFLGAELKINEAVSEFVVGALIDEVKKIENRFDFVLIDTAAGTHCDVITALKNSDISIAVAEATPLGKHDLELIIQLSNELKLESKIVLNKFQEGKSELIEETSKNFNKKIVARIPFKKEIMEQYSKGIPVKDESIQKLAEMFSK